MTQALVIKTADPRMAAGIAEGANAVALRKVTAENQHLRAIQGVRREVADRRWERTKRQLARKYYTPPMNPVKGAILAVWGMLWLGIYNAYDYLSAWNREA